MCTDTPLSLIDHLAACSGCVYVSDLRYFDAHSRHWLAETVKEINAEGYPLSQWKDALAYLFHDAPALQQETAAEARALLIRLLSGKPAN